MARMAKGEAYGEADIRQDGGYAAGGDGDYEEYHCNDAGELNFEY